MYFPYLRGKQFELETILEVPRTVYSNTLPIIEPVNLGARFRSYARISEQHIPFILIMNPYYPRSKPLTTAQVQNLVNTDLATNPNLVLGFIIHEGFAIRALNSFLAANPTRKKALIFRHSPLATELSTIQSAIATRPVEYIIFDDRKSNNPTRNAFIRHPKRVLLTDGFQIKERNADYPAMSSFESNYATWRADGWIGIGDYLTIGDTFKESGGLGFVVTLHITAQASTGLLVHHFSSTIHPTTRGLAASKFLEANDLLNTSPIIRRLRSNGLALYMDWHTRSHFPQLGAAKKASMIHHIELMSRIVV